ncbi:hypothetical protein Osc7112_6777 (plasmid) [Oscillatoria nigro-viridis PCC 7112]|uniref:Uncharacterized protein n=1 Tax=Phormidium nigroviride PCC 7112 TaxID=179408 RepID=K9VTH7_9CYAN|nr:hypothetical protein Osc7112_6777 [Oscillatoria nigro-viridis PCC 7112]
MLNFDGNYALTTDEKPPFLTEVIDPLGRSYRYDLPLGHVFKLVVSLKICRAQALNAHEPLET